MLRNRFAYGITLACLGLLTYFGQQVFVGPKGLRYLDEQQSVKLQLQSKLGDLRVQRQRLDQRVSLMRPETMDRDTLDELARSQLGLADENDIVILLDNKN